MTKEQRLETKYKVKNSHIKSSELDNRTIKAVVNTYNYFDSDFDVLRTGCAKQSINMRGFDSNASDKILHAKDHDLRNLPGKSILEAETVINGNEVLYAESRLSESTDGEDLLIKYNENIYNQHSIGFQYKQLDWIEEGAEDWDKFLATIINPEDADKRGYGWDVKEINWHEWSTVAFGANKLTPYLGTKSENKEIQLQNIYTKMSALIEKSKRLDVKNKKVFELEYKQLEQMIYELVQHKNTEKPKKVASQILSEKKKSFLLSMI